MKRPPFELAVFDVDGTIRPGHLVEDAFWGLTDNGTFKPSAEMTETLLRLRETDHRAYDRALVDAYTDAKKHASVKDIKQHAEHLAMQSLAYLDDDILARIEEYREAGDALAMISGAPDVYVSALAKVLHFDAASGSRFYHNGHRYHPTREAEDRGNREIKPIIAQKIATRLGANGIIAAYGDSMSDLDMLALATHPVAVHPTPELRAEALRRGWEIIG